VERMESGQKGREGALKDTTSSYRDCAPSYISRRYYLLWAEDDLSASKLLTIRTLSVEAYIVPLVNSPSRSSIAIVDPYSIVICRHLMSSRAGFLIPTGGAAASLRQVSKHYAAPNGLLCHTEKEGATHIARSFWEIADVRADLGHLQPEV
jgi:hypothetical protein